MKHYQFFMLASFIFGASQVSSGIGVIMQLTFLIIALIFMLIEMKD